MLDVMRSPEEGDADQLKKRLAEIGVDALLKMVCLMPHAVGAWGLSSVGTTMIYLAGLLPLV